MALTTELTLWFDTTVKSIFLSTCLSGKDPISRPHLSWSPYNPAWLICSVPYFKGPAPALRFYHDFSPLNPALIIHSEPGSSTLDTGLLPFDESSTINGGFSKKDDEANPLNSGTLNEKLSTISGDLTPKMRLRMDDEDLSALNKRSNTLIGRSNTLKKGSRTRRSSAVNGEPNTLKRELGIFYEDMSSLNEESNTPSEESNILSKESFGGLSDSESNFDLSAFKPYLVICEARLSNGQSKKSEPVTLHKMTKVKGELTF